MNSRFAIIVVAIFVLSGCRTGLKSPTLTSLVPTRANTKLPKLQQGELSPKQVAETCIVTAEKLEQAGHGRQAIGLYEKARGHDAKAIDYSRRLAVLYDKEGNVAKASNEYAQAIAIDPKNADLFNDFGQFHLTQGDLSNAETNFQKAIALDANHQRAWTNLGITLGRQARYQEAFEAFARVVGPAAAHSNVGTIMAKQGNGQQAHQAFQQALYLNPTLEQPKAFLTYYAQQSSGQTAIPASFSAPSPMHD